MPRLKWRKSRHVQFQMLYLVVTKSSLSMSSYKSCQFSYLHYNFLLMIVRGWLAYTLDRYLREKCFEPLNIKRYFSDDPRMIAACLQVHDSILYHASTLESAEVPQKLERLSIGAHSGTSDSLASSAGQTSRPASRRAGLASFQLIDGTWSEAGRAESGAKSGRFIERTTRVRHAVCGLNGTPLNGTRARYELMGWRA